MQTRPHKTGDIVYRAGKEERRLIAYAPPNSVGNSLEWKKVSEGTANSHSSQAQSSHKYRRFLEEQSRPKEWSHVRDKISSVLSAKTKEKSTKPVPMYPHRFHMDEDGKIWISVISKTSEKPKLKWALYPRHNLDKMDLRKVMDEHLECNQCKGLVNGNRCRNVSCRGDFCKEHKNTRLSNHRVPRPTRIHLENDEEDEDDQEYEGEDALF